jgi:hypothetical protein
MHFSIETFLSFGTSIYTAVRLSWASIRAEGEIRLLIMHLAGARAFFFFVATQKRIVDALLLLVFHTQDHLLFCLMKASYKHSTLEAGGHIGSFNTNQVINIQVQQQATLVDISTHLLRCPLPSTKFVGRGDELDKLQRFFASDELDRKAFALIGMGGCGKSQIGFHHVHHHVLTDERYDPSMVFFVDATTKTTLEESYATVAKAKGVGSTAKDALLWLSNVPKPTFILMDNADDPEIDFSEYIPRSILSDILITTRLHDAGQNYASKSDAFIDLDALSTEESKQLLIATARLAPNRQEGVEIIVQELYCHPLAVVQAGATISVLRLTVLEYIEQFRRLRTKLMDGTVDRVSKNALNGYPLHVTSVMYMRF